VSRRLAAALALVAALALASCSNEPEAPIATPTPPPVAADPPRAAVGECHQLTYEQALAPATETPAVPCGRPHTSETFFVGELPLEADGHLLDPSAAAAQQTMAATCPRELTAWLRADEETLRLSTLRAVWFTPPAEQVSAGATWFRCDVISVAGTTLTTLGRTLAGALRNGPGVMGLCGTAAPGAAGFTPVACREDHTWRAISVVTFDGRRYPGAEAARAAGQEVCRDAGRDVAADALDFEWGYEWPSREQWQAGQHFGRCWAPEA
jgi:hypothetical protein